jgi:hypothetical protein
VYPDEDAITRERQARIFGIQIARRTRVSTEVITLIGSVEETGAQGSLQRPGGNLEISSPSSGKAGQQQTTGKQDSTN